MKVTKVRKSQKKTLSNPVRPDFVVPQKLKKMLDKSRGIGVVMFEENDHGKWQENDGGNAADEQAKTLISVSADSELRFRIIPAENPLDVYRSPHLLDLASEPKLELSGDSAGQESSYDDLPGGALINSWKMFDFWDLSQSEIYQFGLSLCRNIKNYFSGEKKEEETEESLWSQVLPVRMLLFFADFFYRFYLIGARSCRYIRYAARKWRGEEVMWLPKMSAEAKSKLAMMAEAGSGPTIKEMLSQKGDRQVVMDGKFQMIKSSVDRKKQIREKYLSDPFMRKGVVPAIQKPSMSWPKESVARDLGDFIFAPASLKPVAVFCGVLIALICSVKILSYFDIVSQIKGSVMGEAEQAITNINSAQSGLQSMDFNAAKADIAKAEENFQSAQNQLGGIKSLATMLAEIVPAENAYKSGVNLVSLGVHLSKTAGYLLSAVSAENNADLSLSSRINNLSIELSSALNELVAAKSNADNIGEGSIPAGQKENFAKLKSALPEAIAGLAQARDMADFAVQFLGGSGDLRRYLFVFQNDNELRATGGFMGSFALVDLRGGKIEKITVPEGGTYDVRAGFNEKVAPPEALRLVASRFEFQDSNWWADFPTSAQNIKWFYEKSGGPTVDGVVAVNSSFFGDLLKVTGPIALKTYGKTITADNFESELQKSIELEALDKTKPKKIISELAPIMMEKILSSDPKAALKLAESLNAAVKRRDLQLYSADDRLEKFIKKSGWSGELADFAGGDFLSVNATNVGGGKTDAAIRQSVSYRAEIQADGSVLGKLIIERHHFGPIDNVFTTIANNSYLRVYVPLGSRLVSAVGFKNFSSDKFKTLESGLTQLDSLKNEKDAAVDKDSGTKVYSENGKTVFANWSVVGPGETETMLLVYQLPFTVSSPAKNIVTRAADLLNPSISAYALKFQKQSGRSSDEFMAQVVYPQGFSLKFSYPESLKLSEGEIDLASTTATDLGLVAGFIKK